MFPLLDREGKDCLLYIQRHILQLQMTMQEIHHPRDNHALFYAPPCPGITSAVIALGYSNEQANQEHAPPTPRPGITSAVDY